MIDFYVDSLEDSLCGSMDTRMLAQNVRQWNWAWIDGPGSVESDTDLNSNWMYLHEMILDPCGLFDSPDWHVNSLRVDESSSIEGRADVTWNGQSILANLSPLVSLDPHLLFSFVDGALEVMHQSGYSDESLITKMFTCIYVNQLLSLSLAIPSEFNWISNYSWINIFATRIINESVSIDIDGVVVGLDEDESGSGDPIDIVVAVIENDDADQLNGNSQCTHLSDRSVDIHSLNGNDSQIHGNVSILFGNETRDNQGGYTCVWWDESTSTWSEDGCTTVVNQDTGSVQCICSHLTRFAIIESLHDDSCQSPLNQSDWRFANLSFVSLYGFIVIYSIYKFTDLYRHKVFSISLLRRVEIHFAIPLCFGGHFNYRHF